MSNTKAKDGVSYTKLRKELGNKLAPAPSSTDKSNLENDPQYHSSKPCHCEAVDSQLTVGDFIDSNSPGFWDIPTGVSLHVQLSKAEKKDLGWLGG